MGHIYGIGTTYKKHFKKWEARVLWLLDKKDCCSGLVRLDGSWWESFSGVKLYRADRKNRLITWRPLLSIPYIRLLLFFSIIYNIHSASLAHYEQKKSGRAPQKMLSVGLRALSSKMFYPVQLVPFIIPAFRFTIPVSAWERRRRQQRASACGGLRKWTFLL